MNFQPHRFLVLLSGLALMVALNSCQPSASQAKGNPVSELSDKDTLMASLRELQRMTIIYPASSDSANQYLAWGEKMAQNSRFLQIDVQSDEAFSDSQLHSSVLFLLGKMEDNRLIKSWKDQLPVTPNSSGFRFQDKNYLASNHSILLSWYPNPLAPTLPLAILTGNSEEAIFAIMNHPSGRGRMGMPWSSWD